MNRQLLKQIAPSLRARGFRGSGQTYRATEGDFVFIINFQGSRWGDVFYVNLGAQPTLIPSEGDVELARLREHHCVFRERVGGEWPWQLSEEQFTTLERQLSSAQAAFFGNLQTLRSSLAVDSPDSLLTKFTTFSTEARASLHLARAAAKLGHSAKARALAERGIELAGKSATLLLADLQRVLDDLPH